MAQTKNGRSSGAGKRKTPSRGGARRKSKQKNSFFLLLVTLITITVVFALVALVACEDSDESSSNTGNDIGNSAENMDNSSNESIVDNSSESSYIDNNDSQDSSDSGDGSNDVISGDTSSSDVSDDSQDVSSEVSKESFAAVEWYKSENSDRYDAYAKENPEFTEEQVVTYVNMGLDNEFYTNIYPANKEDGLFILVNKYSYVDRNYTPDNLVELDDACKVSGKSVKLVKEAADAFARLSADAARLEYHIIGMSGYRTYAYQESLYNRYLINDTKENVDTYSARPGHSEHHTGLALDVQTDKVSFSNFGQTKEYEWLLDNAHKYGFVIHYTESNQWITGYMPEEWHIRYLGVEAATYIYNHNLSVDEYLIMYGANGPGAVG